MVVVISSQPTLGEMSQPSTIAGGIDIMVKVDQRIGRKEGHAPVVMVGEAHFLFGEELVMHQRVAVIDRAKCRDLRRTVHDDSGESTTRRNWHNRNVTGTISHSHQLNLMKVCSHRWKGR